MATDDERKQWRGRLMADGTGRMFPVDEDNRPHPQVSQGLNAMRRAQRPTLRRSSEQRLGAPPGLFARGRAAEPDTDPGRPPGDPPGPPVRSEEIDGGWGTPPETAAPQGGAASNDPILHVRQSELERMVDNAVAAKLDPIAAAISDMRGAMMRQGGPVPTADASVAVEAEPVALLPLVDELPVEPVAELAIPDQHDWTQGKVAEFAPAPVAQGG